MTVKDIIGEHVFMKDKTTGQIMRFNVRDFEGSIQRGADAEKRNGKYHCTSSTVDVDCVNGVCPIR